MYQRILIIIVAFSRCAAEPSITSNSRELYGTTSTYTSSGWTMWSSLFQLLDHIHAPCPPGSKDSSGNQLKPGECWQANHMPHPHKSSSHKSSSSSSHKSGSSSHKSSSHSHSHSHSGGHYHYWYNYTECYQGDENCYENPKCLTDDGSCYKYICCDENDADCLTWLTCTDDSTNCLNNAKDDDAWNNDAWKADGYELSSSQAANNNNKAVWPLVLIALVVAAASVAFIVKRQRASKPQSSDYVLAGANGNSKSLFSGLWKEKGLNDNDGKIEIAGSKGAYKTSNRQTPV